MCSDVFSVGIKLPWLKTFTKSPKKAAVLPQLNPNHKHKERTSKEHTSDKMFKEN